jgi:hypothetical protein
MAGRGPAPAGGHLEEPPLDSYPEAFVRFHVRELGNANINIPIIFIITVIFQSTAPG